MLKKLLAAGIVFAAGYIVGAIFGFRAAVVDYVEDDAEKIEKMAADIYPSPDEGAASGDRDVPPAIEEAIKEAKEESHESKGFQ